MFAGCRLPFFWWVGGFGGEPFLRHVMLSATQPLIFVASQVDTLSCFFPPSISSLMAFTTLDSDASSIRRILLFVSLPPAVVRAQLSLPF